MNECDPLRQVITDSLQQVVTHIVASLSAQYRRACVILDFEPPLLKRLEQNNIPDISALADLYAVWLQEFKRDADSPGQLRLGESVEAYQSRILNEFICHVHRRLQSDAKPGLPRAVLWAGYAHPEERDFTRLALRYAAGLLSETELEELAWRWSRVPEPVEVDWAPLEQPTSRPPVTVSVRRFSLPMFEGDQDVELRCLHERQRFRTVQQLIRSAAWEYFGAAQIVGYDSPTLTPIRALRDFCYRDDGSPWDSQVSVLLGAFDLMAAWHRFKKRYDAHPLFPRTEGEWMAEETESSRFFTQEIRELLVDPLLVRACVLAMDQDGGIPTPRAELAGETVECALLWRYAGIWVRSESPFPKEPE